MEEEKKPYGTVLLKAAKIIDHLSNCKEAQSLAAIAASTRSVQPNGTEDPGYAAFDRICREG